VQLVVDTIEREPKSIGDAQFVIKPAQVVFDHLLGSTELTSNLLVVLAPRDADDNGQLFR
jgi:hypothetical protein